MNGEKWQEINVHRLATYVNECEQKIRQWCSEWMWPYIHVFGFLHACNVITTEEGIYLVINWNIKNEMEVACI